MDDSSELFTGIIAKFSDLRGRMKAVAHLIRSRFPGSTVQHSIDFVGYDAKNVIEMFVDIALGAGKSWCWWIDVERGGQVWKVEASLRESDGIKEDSLWEASYDAGTVDELFLHLSSVLDEMDRFVSKEWKCGNQ